MPTATSRDCFLVPRPPGTWSTCLNTSLCLLFLPQTGWLRPNSLRGAEPGRRYPQNELTIITKLMAWLCAIYVKKSRHKNPESIHICTYVLCFSLAFFCVLTFFQGTTWLPQIPHVYVFPPAGTWKVPWALLFTHLWMTQVSVLIAWPSVNWPSLLRKARDLD